MMCARFCKVFPGWCDMAQCRAFQRKSLALVLIILLLACVSSLPAQTNSRAAAITLTAVLSQSLSLSASPDGAVFNSFLNSGERTSPLKIKANWVRGPGQVSVTAFVSGSSGDADSRLLERRAVSADPQLEIDTSELRAPVRGEEGVLTIRAQVI